MINDRLFINGKEVQLAPNTVIAPTYQINDIAELKDRQANFTNQLKAPKNGYNQEILEDAELIQSLTLFPYRRLPARVLKLGIEIMPGAYAVIQSVDQFYNIVVYSGNIDFFQRLEGKTLQDLNLSEFDHDFDHFNIVIRNTSTEVMYPIINYGTLTNADRNVDLRNLRPAISFWTLFEKIIEETGFGYDILTPLQDKITKIILPYSKNDDDIYDSGVIDGYKFRATRTTDDAEIKNNISLYNRKLIFDDDSTGSNSDPNNTYNNTTGVQRTYLNARYNYAGKFKLFVRTSTLPDPATTAIIQFNNYYGHHYTIGETINANNGASGSLIYQSAGILIIGSISGDWSTAASITGVTSGLSDTLNLYFEPWDTVIEMIHYAFLDIYVNGSISYSLPIVVGSDNVRFETTAAANPDPDTDTDRKYKIVSFDTTAISTSGLNFGTGDNVEFYVRASADVAFKDAAGVWTFIPNDYVKVEFGIEFDNIEDTNVIQCDGILLQPFTYGSTISMSGAMPDLQQKDFVKAIAQKFGIIFDHDVFNNTLVIRQFADIVKNIPQAEDLSDVLDDNPDDPIEYRIGSYAQTNFLTYAKDDDDKLIAPKTGNGQFTIDDATLPVEKTLIELFFAATFMGKYLLDLDVPYISKIDEDGLFKLNALQRCLILDTQDISGDPIHYFDESSATDTNSNIPLCYFSRTDRDFNLGFNNSLIPDNYSDLVRCLQQAKKITPRFNLDANYIHNLDFFKPVYLKKYSAYFYKNRILNFKGDSLTKMELIRL